jgi:3-oxoacyl-[acyl-carrier-protein] synthase II
VKRRAVVTGIGLVTPIGTGVAEFWSRALAGSAACAPIPEHWRLYYQPLSTIWAPLPSRDFSSFDISRIEASQLDPVEQIALACARQALDAAGLACELKDAKKNTFAVKGIDPPGFGVFVGTGVGGAATLLGSAVAHVGLPVQAGLDRLRRRLAGDGAGADAVAEVEALRSGLRVPARFDTFAVPRSMPNGCSAVVGIKYGLLGRNATCAGACASGTIAIGQALRAVQSGEMTLALAGGVEYVADDWGGVFRGFDVVRTLVRAGDDPARANRPFDARRSGFLFAEGGGAVLVVEELEHARRRGAPVIAELLGYGETFDAHSVMMIEPSGTHVERMVRQALDDAGVAPEGVDYVNAHGTGTVLNDETESAMLRRVFGDRPLVNSTKGLVGHTIGASGAIEAAVAALSIRDQTTHPCVNLEEPIGGLRYVREQGRFRIACALSESFAFGGHNAAVVMGELRP